MSSGNLADRRRSPLVAIRLLDRLDLAQDVRGRFLPDRPLRLIRLPIRLARAIVRSSRGKSGVKNAWSR